MKKLSFLLAFTATACSPRAPADPEAAAWEARAAAVTITRDDLGIPHVTGKTDADVVFGVTYAQAEDDFNRVETNYLNAMGRLAEAEGEGAIWRDLRMKLFVDPDSLKAHYAASPEWLRHLMDAWADGLNYFLHTHPEVTPRVITRFEPWMALSFTEGSIGGDIETISLARLEEFYRGSAPGEAVALDPDAPPAEPSGSNGFAIASSLTASGKAMLLINPHTSFFFRAVAQMTSDEGLNAYGALTWGQFFIYQGFNDRLGWMHTSSGSDAIDEFAETIVRMPDGGLASRYGNEERQVITRTIAVPFRTDTGLAVRNVTVYRTHHGPVVRQADGKWIAVSLMQEPIKALTQSYSRTRARTMAEFRQTMELHTNSSNNTIYADADGNIAYWHANFVPRRNPKLAWDRPVDGSDPATGWQGIHSIDESPNLFNPAVGWIQNTNNAPWSAAGPDSPKAKDYPSYFDRAGENPRGIHAIRVLEGRSGFTLDSLIAAAYDSYLTAFADLVPPLLTAYDRLPASSPLRARLAEPVQLLREWDLRWSVGSVATSVAVFWGQELWRRARADAESEALSVYEHMARRMTPAARLEALADATDTLAARFGDWRTPWGDINRFQRLTGDIVQPFNDSGPSLPVGFTSAQWGSLASFGARAYPGTKKIYGTSGNSFVAVVEFGDSVVARAVTAGGQNGNPASPHFNDQAERYARGDLRDVYFYPNQLKNHTERTYRPGER